MISERYVTVGCDQTAGYLRCREPSGSVVMIARLRWVRPSRDQARLIA